LEHVRVSCCCRRRHVVAGAIAFGRANIRTHGPILTGRLRETKQSSLHVICELSQPGRSVLSAATGKMPHLKVFQRKGEHGSGARLAVSLFREYKFANTRRNGYGASPAAPSHAGRQLRRLLASSWMMKGFAVLGRRSRLARPMGTTASNQIQ